MFYVLNNTVRIKIDGVTINKTLLFFKYNTYIYRYIKYFDIIKIDSTNASIKINLFCKRRGARAKNIR